MKYKDYEFASLAELAEGRNKKKITSCKITNIITKMNDAPAYYFFIIRQIKNFYLFLRIFVIVDYKSEFGALSIYSTY